MKRLIILLGFYLLLEARTNAAGEFFNVIGRGASANLNVTLCLNGKGPLSCQHYLLSSLNLILSTTLPNHSYPIAGIKINAPGYTLSGCTFYKNGYCLFSTSNSAPANVVLSNSSYELVTIGNPGNSNDDTGFGAVSYSYRIGKYSVTIREYTDFLNAVAKTDTYSLYHTEMATDLNSAGISRSGASGNYVYSVMNNSGISANRPITYVTWFNAARFANWMSNGKPVGSQNRTTTENGAYALNGTTSGIAPAKNLINPNTGSAPTYYIPLENEWYKAAYYNPMLNSYYDFATKSNTAPGNTIGHQLNQANYFIANGKGFSVTQSLTFHSRTQNYLTDVGSFTASASYYGTFDQNGDADQWNDLDGTPSLYRGLRGGFYFAGPTPLKSLLFAKSIATNFYNGGGFRLASPV
jgi:sulfatase modifying factor 1